MERHGKSPRRFVPTFGAMADEFEESPPSPRGMKEPNLAAVVHPPSGAAVKKRCYCADTFGHDFGHPLRGSDTVGGSRFPLELFRGLRPFRRSAGYNNGQEDAE
jgi:hypothetical protein